MDSLVRNYQFKDFSEALAFVNAVGGIAETLNHHPDILLHDWNQVTITSLTHDAGDTITSKDHELIEQIDSTFQKLGNTL